MEVTMAAMVVAVMTTTQIALAFQSQSAYGVNVHFAMEKEPLSEILLLRPMEKTVRFIVLSVAVATGHQQDIVT